MCLFLFVALLHLHFLVLRSFNSTYFENLGHLKLEGFESSKFLSKILVAKKERGFFFATKILVRNS